VPAEQVRRQRPQVIQERASHFSAAAAPDHFWIEETFNVGSGACAAPVASRSPLDRGFDHCRRDAVAPGFDARLRPGLADEHRPPHHGLPGHRAASV
jgi:hypothetical protein